jgi:hypothetical protein
MSTLDTRTHSRGEAAVKRKRALVKTAAQAFRLSAAHEYRVLSIHPEWAWAIIFGGKDIENRSWATDYRGTLLIHASSRRNSREDLAFTRDLICSYSGLDSDELPAEFPASAILGAVELVDCVDDAKSAWADGEVHWVLRNPRPLARPVRNIRGKLQIWRWTPTPAQVRESEAVPSVHSQSSQPQLEQSIKHAAPRPPLGPAQGRAPSQRMDSGPERRPISDVPPQEILDALRSSVGSRPANENDVLRAASRRLGFTRMGARVEQALKSQLRVALNKRLVIRDERGLRSGTTG